MHVLITRTFNSDYYAALPREGTPPLSVHPFVRLSTVPLWPISTEPKYVETSNLNDYSTRACNQERRSWGFGVLTTRENMYRRGQSMF